MNPPIRAAVFDWAGTTVDYGCLGPVAVIERVLAERGYSVPREEIRRDMGLKKIDHMSALCARAGIAASLVPELYERFEAIQGEVILGASHVLPWIPAAVEALRALGLRIGSTTGYTRAMLEPILRQARAESYAPEASVTPDDAPAGRPFPWMLYLNAMRLGVHPMRAIVKVGDTPADMAEARNAGCWAVGVTVGGNEIGLPESEWLALPAPDRERLRESAAARLKAAGAHLVLDTAADLPEALPLLARMNYEER